MKQALLFAVLIFRCECSPPGEPDASTRVDAGADGGMERWCYQPHHRAPGPTDDQCFATLQACEDGRAFSPLSSECWSAAP